jgi:serine phosphatase RsbU (regulator of sigma subunit)
MKRIVFLLLLFISFCLPAQNSIEQLKGKLASVKEDTSYVSLCLAISKKYFKTSFDSAVHYARKALLVAEKIKDKKSLFRTNDILGSALLKKGAMGEGKGRLLYAYSLGRSLPLSDDYFLNLFHVSSLYLQSKNSDSALYYLNIAYNRSLSYSDRSFECKCYGNLGEYYRSFSEYEKAVDYFYKALKCNEQNPQIDHETEFTAFMGIGSINYSSSKFNNAIEYFEKALSSAYAKTMAGENELSILNNNLGACYYTIGNEANDTALKNKGISYFKKVLEQNIRSGNKSSMGRLYGNLGSVYANDGRFEEAKPYFEKAIELAVETNNKQSEAKNLYSLAELVGKMNDSLGAEQYYSRAINVAHAGKLKEILVLIYGNLNVFYKERKNYVLAHEYLQKYVTQKDSLLNEQNQNKIATLKTQYDTEKKDQQIQLLAKDKLLKELFIDKQEGELLKQRSEAEQQSYKIKILNDEKRLSQVLLTNEKLEKEKKLRENELLTQQNDLSRKTLEQQKLIIGLIAIGLVITLVAIVLVFRQYRQKQKANEIITRQKHEVEKQKEIIEEKQKEITDSIHYAKRIQRILLASDAFLNKYLPSHFILYKPKDIVSGDFYWAARTEDGRILLATADCTGHGVPGAFMSLLGVNFLNDIINDKRITQPNRILDQLRRDIIYALNPEGTETEAKDGMDAVLCSFDFSKMEMQFAAANNAVWVIREGDLLEFQPDKMPVGKYFEDERDFKLQSVALKKDDIIYTFTDGYADQFGGPKSKKFKPKTLQKLLLSICNLPMSEQRKRLETAMDEWKGGNEQIDDILIIGVRV